MHSAFLLHRRIGIDRFYYAIDSVPNGDIDPRGNKPKNDLKTGRFLHLKLCEFADQSFGIILGIFDLGRVDAAYVCKL